MNNNYGPPPGFSPPPFGYGPPPGAPIPPNPMNPGYPGGMPPMQPANNGLAIASLVTGIVGLFPGCCCVVLGIPLSVGALVMGLVAMSQINRSQGRQGGRGLAIAGAVLGGTGTAMSIINAAFSFSNQMMRSAHIHI
ncbi:MAG TPA: DUF4190 domain-containing protein [Polyangiaceae bacterium]|jgi:hypothetical protein